MNPSLFSQAIDEVFPKLDLETRTEIYNKVNAHMFVVTKEKVFTQDQEGLRRLQQLLTEEADVTKQTKLYIKCIMEKFASLPDDERKKIDQELDDELTQIMHKIYQAYE